jgi:hypothetical protein
MGSGTVARARRQTVRESVDVNVHVAETAEHGKKEVGADCALSVIN